MEIKELVRNSKTKSCALDPAPNFIVKNCLDTLVEHIRTIVNNSFHQAIFPQRLKNVIIIPCIKKASLDPNELSNNRPIVNLPFLSKIIERAAVRRLNSTYLPITSVQ